MKFGVNALFLIPGEVGGSETSVRRTLPALASRLAPHEELVVFANAENRDALAADLRDAPRVTVVATGLRAVSRVRRVLFENLTLPRVARALGLGALWNPGNAALHRAPCPQVTTIYDMQYRHFPEDFPFAARLAMRRAVPAAVRRSALVLAISEFSRREILGELPDTPDDRVVVTPLAADPFFAKPVPGPALAEAAFSLTGGADPFLLVVSNSYPHKSIETAVRAFGRLSAEIPHRLVVVGRPRRGEPAVEAALAELPDRGRVSRIHYVSLADLTALYHSADLLVFPSRYEGFGLPVLEAMTAGLPVIAAREGSVPEVAGPAAVYARTGDPDDFARAIRELLADPAERARRAEAGRERARLFSWDRTAELTLAALRRVAR